MAKKQQKPKPRGRPSQFSDRLAERLLDLATKGATDAQLAKAAGVGLATFYAWKGRHADFREALKDAKAVADDLVEASLYRKATGYSHKAIKFFCYEGSIVWQKYTEHYPPDTTACIFWLKNRQPDRWRDQPKEQVSSLVPFVIKRLDGSELVLGSGAQDTPSGDGQAEDGG